MQKVVGSSPISGLREARSWSGFFVFWGRNSCGSALLVVMSIDELRSGCRGIDRFIDRLVELELPLSDEGSVDGDWLALHWSATGVTFWFEPNAEEAGVI